MANIIVYSTPACPHCHIAKDFLKEHNIPFEDVNVAADRARAREMVEKSGQMSVPVIDVSGTILVGFNQEALEKALKL